MVAGFSPQKGQFMATLTECQKERQKATENIEPGRKALNFFQHHYPGCNPQNETGSDDKDIYQHNVF